LFYISRLYFSWRVCFSELSFQQIGHIIISVKKNNVPLVWYMYHNLKIAASDYVLQNWRDLFRILCEISPHMSTFPIQMTHISISFTFPHVYFPPTPEKSSVTHPVSLSFHGSSSSSRSGMRPT